MTKTTGKPVFEIGDKVLWHNGINKWYTIDQVYYDCGWRYSLKNNYDQKAGINVMQHELELK